MIKGLIVLNSLTYGGIETMFLKALPLLTDLT